MEIPGPVLLDRESEARSSGPRSRFGGDGRSHADGPEGPSGFCVTRLFVLERKGPQSLRRSDSSAGVSLVSVSRSDRRRRERQTPRIRISAIVATTPTRRTTVTRPKKVPGHEPGSVTGGGAGVNQQARGAKRR